MTQQPNSTVHRQICTMLASNVATVYSLPLEEGNGVRVALVFFSPFNCIEVIHELIILINEMEINYRLQVFESSTEIHFEELEYFNLVLILETLTSVDHHENGNWGFFFSGMGAVVQ